MTKMMDPVHHRQYMSGDTAHVPPGMASRALSGTGYLQVKQSWLNAMIEREKQLLLLVERERRNGDSGPSVALSKQLNKEPALKMFQFQALCEKLAEAENSCSHFERENQALLEQIALLQVEVKCEKIEANSHCIAKQESETQLRLARNKLSLLQQDLEHERSKSELQAERDQSLEAAVAREEDLLTQLCRVKQSNSELECRLRDSCNELREMDAALQATRRQAQSLLLEQSEELTHARRDWEEERRGLAKRSSQVPQRDPAAPVADPSPSATAYGCRLVAGRSLKIREGDDGRSLKIREVMIAEAMGRVRGTGSERE